MRDTGEDVVNDQDRPPISFEEFKNECDRAGVKFYKKKHAKFHKLSPRKKLKKIKRILYG